MKTKSIMIIALILTVSSGIFAQGNQDKKRPGNEGPLMNIPDLTDNQKEKIKDLRTDHMKEILPLKNELKEKEAHLKTISTGENADLNKVYQAIDEMGALKIKMVKKHAAFKFEIRKLLTEDQKVYFDMHSSKKHEHKKMMHKQHHMNN